MSFIALFATFVFFGGGVSASTVPFVEQQFTTITKILSLARISDVVVLDVQACPTTFTGVEYVVCDQEGYVTHANLAGTGMSGFLAYHFGVLTRLVYLNVSHNNLTGPLNALVKNLKQLRHFDISSNYMTGDAVDVVQHLPLLEQCVIVARGGARNTNCFEGVLPRRFSACNLDDFESLELCSPFLARSKPLPALPTVAATTTAIAATTTAAATTKKATTAKAETQPRATESRAAEPSTKLESVQRTLMHQQSQSQPQPQPQSSTAGTYVLVNGLLRSDRDPTDDTDVDFVVIIVFVTLAAVVCIVCIALAGFVFVRRKRDRECEEPFHNSMHMFNEQVVLPPPPDDFNMSQKSLSALPPPLTVGTLPASPGFVDVQLHAVGDKNYGRIDTVRRPGDEYSSLPITSTLRQRPVHNGVVYDRVLKKADSHSVAVYGKGPPAAPPAAASYGRAPPPALYNTNSSSATSTISSTSSTKDYGAMMAGFMEQRRPNDDEESF